MAKTPRRGVFAIQFHAATPHEDWLLGWDFAEPGDSGNGNRGCIGASHGFCATGCCNTRQRIGGCYERGYFLGSGYR